METNFSYFKFYTVKEKDFAINLCKLMNLNFEVYEVKDTISYTEIKVLIEGLDTKACFYKMLAWNYTHNIVA